MRTPRSWSCFTAPSERLEGLRRLGDRHPLQEAHDQALALLVGQLGEGGEQRLVGQPGEDGALRALGRVVVRRHVLGGHLEAGAAGLEVVGGEVARDGHQPGAEVLALPPEVVHAPQRAEEGLRGEVLGQRLRARAVVEEAVDRRLVVVVEQPEGLLVARAGELDERDQPLTLGLVDLRGGGLVLVADRAGARGAAAALAGRRAGPSRASDRLGVEDAAGELRGEGSPHRAPKRVEAFLQGMHAVVPPSCSSLHDKGLQRPCEPVSNYELQEVRTRSRPRTLTPAATAPDTAPATAAATSPARAALRPVR